MFFIPHKLTFYYTNLDISDPSKIHNGGCIDLKVIPKFQWRCFVAWLAIWCLMYTNSDQG